MISPLNRNPLWMIGLLLLLISGNVLAKGSLSVTLSQPVQRSDAGVVTITMENTGDGPMSIFRWKTPFAVNDDRLANPQFDVRDSSGNEIPYQGRNVNFGPITPSSFIILKPHQSISKDIDLASDYALVEGVYAVSFSIDLQVRPNEDGPDGTKATDIPINDQIEVRSNTLNVLVRSDALSEKMFKSLGTEETSAQYVCSAGQTSQLGSLVSTAASQSLSAMNYLGSTYQWILDANGVATSGNNTDARYTYWFGTYDTSISPTDPNSIYSDNAQVDQTMVAVYYRLAYEPFTYECGCDPVKYPPETRAWAESGNPYYVHICTSFWDLQVNGSPVSQVGTLIHEASHFNDSQNSARADYAYGPLTVHNLAITSRTNAVRNADNYMFYIMDAPRQ